jgi:hypothetical protein
LLVGGANMLGYYALGPLGRLVGPPWQVGGARMSARGPGYHLVVWWRQVCRLVGPVYQVAMHWSHLAGWWGQDVRSLCAGIYRQS